MSWNSSMKKCMKNETKYSESEINEPDINLRNDDENDQIMMTENIMYSMKSLKTMIINERLLMKYSNNEIMLIMTENNDEYQ